MLKEYFSNSLKLSFVLILAALFLQSIASSALASEGTFELRSTTGEDYRCFVASLQRQDRKFRVLVSCRDLIYPAEGDIFAYILWARPLEGDGPIKLGALGFGKAGFETGRAFSSLFVTTERNRGTRNPQGDIVMSGVLQPIRFLEKPTTPTPTPEDEEGEASQEQESNQQEQPKTTREKLVEGLKRAGIIAGFALVALIGLIFVITRMRG